MADRSSDEAKRATCSDLMIAVEEYLVAHGWPTITVRTARIQQEPGTTAGHYELVVRFTGSQQTPKAATRR
jgi:hypothetical protein